MDKIPMTPDGHATLSEELKRRVSVERPRIIQAIADARGHGDLSENAEYHTAKDAQGYNESRIADLESILALADVIDVTKLTGKTVKFGATVTIVDEDTEQKKKVMLVGDPEADAGNGRISISSPLARAMIGKSVGESIEVTAPGGARAYEILRIVYK